MATFTKKEKELLYDSVTMITGNIESRIILRKKLYESINEKSNPNLDSKELDFILNLTKRTQFKLREKIIVLIKEKQIGLPVSDKIC